MMIIIIIKTTYNDCEHDDATKRRKKADETKI